MSVISLIFILFNFLLGDNNFGCCIFGCGAVSTSGAYNGVCVLVQKLYVGEILLPDMVLCV